MRTSRHFISRGQGFMLLSTFLFSLMNLFVKALERLPNIQIICIRALVGMVLGFIFLQRMKIKSWGRQKPLLILRGILGTCALYLFFYSIREMPLATAVTLQYLSPLLVILLSSFILREHAPTATWALSILALAGTILVKGFDTGISFVDLLAGIGSAFFSALAYNMVRKLKYEDHPLLIVFYFALVSFLISLPFTLHFWVAPSLREWSYLIVIGVLVQTAQYCLTMSLQLEKAARVTPLSYLGTPLAIIYGLILFDEKISLSSLLGIGLILLGAVGASLAANRSTQASDAAPKKSEGVPT